MYPNHERISIMQHKCLNGKVLFQIGNQFFFII
jgi:hypothetical protein